MKKKIILASIFAVTLFAPATQVEAKPLEFAYIFDDGCMGKMYVHSAFFGLFQWVTYERISC